MKVTLDHINYKGHYFEEVTVDIPQIDDLNSPDAQLMITYFVTKELGRMIRE